MMEAGRTPWRTQKEKTRSGDKGGGTRRTIRHEAGKGGGEDRVAMGAADWEGAHGTTESD